MNRKHMREIGQEEIDKIESKNAAVAHREADKRMVEKLELGDSVVAYKGSPNEVRGFIEEILKDGRVSIANWDNWVTIPARLVEKQ